MSYSSLAIANAFLELDEQSTVKVPAMTNMKIQKLVYIAHGFTLAMCDGLPLISSHVHAFQWGPVMPVLYDRLKKYGKNPVPKVLPLLPEIATIDLNDPSSVETAIIHGVWDKYGKLRADELSNITHQPDTPWDITWKATPFGVIPNDLIQSHYLGILQKV
jgi:uncharacterized phage-associated protein